MAATPTVLAINNTGSGNVLFSVVVQELAGSAYIQYNNNGSAYYSIGTVPGSLSLFAINPTSVIPTSSNAITMNSDGNIYGASTPAFLAKKATAQVNATGNGTTSTINFDSVVQNTGCYDGTNTFTAPVTGVYRLFTIVTASTVTGTSGTVSIATSSIGTFGLIDMNPTNFAGSDGFLTVSGSIIANLTAGDTAKVQIKFTGGTLTTSLPNSATGQWYGGILIG